MMPDFKDLKKVVNSKYFTLDFYNTFIKDYREAMFGYGSYENVKKSDFYISDTSKYPNFIRTFHSELPLFKINFYNNINELVASLDANFENAETAKQYYLPVSGNFRVEVVKTAY